MWIENWVQIFLKILNKMLDFLGRRWYHIGVRKKKHKQQSEKEGKLK
jgi:hypothetical protein